MKREIFRYAIMLIALGLFGYSAYELALIAIESKESVAVYDEVKNMFITEVPAGEEETDEHGRVIENSSSGGKFVWDYEKMLNYNSEALGYIRQDDGEYIDNPILQHSDNDYYLSHLADHTESSVGSIFVDYRITEGLEAKNCIIYGHNMGTRVNNIMFGSLNWYLNGRKGEDYYKEHPTLDVYVGYRHYKYYIFAAYRTEAVGGGTYTYSFADDEAFLAYVDACIENSAYVFEEAGEITAEDKIITLSTCTGDDTKRMIIQAVRREEINDVPNIPEDEILAVDRGVISIGGDGGEDDPSEETTGTGDPSEESTEQETTENSGEETETTEKPTGPEASATDAR